MKHIFTALVVLIGLCPPNLAFAAKRPLLESNLPTDFSEAQWRQALKELAQLPASEPTQVIGPIDTSKPSGKFLRFFLDEIEPVLIQSEKWENVYWAHMVLLDSGLFRSQSEKDRWETQKAAAEAFFDQLSTDDVWHQKIIQWGQLAGDLSGQLADAAREMAKIQELNHYPSSHKALVERETRLSSQIRQAASTLKAIPVAQKNDAAYQVAELSYYQGKSSFDQASRKMEELQKVGSRLIGQELLQTQKDALLEMPKLKTQLAQSKGFKNWAELELARQSNNYSTPFKTAEGLLQFLYDLLSKTDDVAQAIYKKAAAKHGKSLNEIRPTELALLLPPADSLMHGVFQPQDMVRVWRETMYESGFSDQQIRRILVDAYPRANKWSHAYMAPVKMASIKKSIVDAATLNYMVPESAHEGWTLPVTAIVQNLTDPSIDSLRTMFHEGGHGLDFATQRNFGVTHRSAGYAETHSTTMEYFLVDRSFLLRKGRGKDGSRISEKAVDRYINEKKILEIIYLRASILQSILDIELWNYDYTAPGSQTIWERAEDLQIRLRERVRFAKMPSDLKDLYRDILFSTDHFYGGSVRYFGYVLASVAARLVYDHALNHLETTTGRRSLDQQPLLASILLPIYRRGPSLTFPASIELPTGMTFDAATYSRFVVEEAMTALSQISEAECIQVLKKE